MSCLRAFLSGGLCLALAACAASAPEAIGVELVNGKWFDGQSFVEGTWYATGGVLTQQRPGTVERVVDLDGGFVLPPFAEAHNHNIGRPPREGEIERYVEDGIFYVMVQSNLPGEAPAAADHPVEVLYANGGLTAPRGHVVEVNERLVDWGVLKMAKEDLDGHAFFVVETAADLERKWDALLDGKPDFVKVFLGFSEETERRRSDPRFDGKRGLDPDLLPSIVERAHRAGLRVSAHIETSADFRVAVETGVDLVAHLPAWRVGEEAGFDERKMDRWLIGPADVRRAAERGTVVITSTLAGKGLRDADHPDHAFIREIYRRNLVALAAAGVRLAVGSDYYDGTAVAEIAMLARAPLLRDLVPLGVFDNGELLTMWCRTTAEAILPDRKVGELREGYEASFLVLEGDPLDDLANVRRINMRFKGGEELTATSP